MSLRRDEAITLDHRHVLSVSVLDCDEKDCNESFLVGPGDGRTLSEGEFADIEAEGWETGDRGDYCPKHKALVSKPLKPRGSHPRRMPP